MEAPTTNRILPPGTAFAPALLPGRGGCACWGNCKQSKAFLMFLFVYPKKTCFGAFFLKGGAANGRDACVSAWGCNNASRTRSRADHNPAA